MNKQPKTTRLLFVPVPAMPITVLPTPKGVRVVRTAAGVFAGATMREAIEAAHGITAPKGGKEGEPSNG